MPRNSIQSQSALPLLQLSWNTHTGPHIKCSHHLHCLPGRNGCQYRFCPQSAEVSSRWACVNSEWPARLRASSHEGIPPFLLASQFYLHMYAEKESSLLVLRQRVELHSLARSNPAHLCFALPLAAPSISHPKGTQPPCRHAPLSGKSNSGPEKAQSVTEVNCWRSPEPARVGKLFETVPAGENALGKKLELVCLYLPFLSLVLLMAKRANSWISSCSPAPICSQISCTSSLATWSEERSK